MTGTYKLEVSYNDLMNIFSRKHPGTDREGIKRAYTFANEKHSGVRRKSGEPYINHCLRAARLLAEHGFADQCLIAALLHDVVEDCDVTLPQIREMFSREVAKTVDAVTSLSDRDYDGRKLTKKQRKNLIRIIVAAVTLLFILMRIRFSSSPWIIPSSSRPTVAKKRNPIAA